MLEEMEKLEATGNTKVPPPPRQKILDWIEFAWKAIKEKKDQIAKSFVVTGIGTVNGKWEEALIRNEQVREEIEKEMEVSFGTEQLPCEPEGDPFNDVSSDSDDDTSNDEVSICSYREDHSEDSISCGDYSEITDPESA